uniref:Apolipoprotein L domain containing 1 n=1 Tax=Molossus molossus TaxID=27622 RepID=A0A7J8FVC1_MOLMO|nr:apolipoprotein L domain containing 1 [Molossus molossus]
MKAAGARAGNGNSQNETRLSQGSHWFSGSIKDAHPETASDFSFLETARGEWIEMLYFCGLSAIFKKFPIMMSTMDMKVGIFGNSEGCTPWCTVLSLC